MFLIIKEIMIKNSNKRCYKLGLSEINSLRSDLILKF